MNPLRATKKPTKLYYNTGSYLWVRGDDQERLINLVPWLNGYNSTLSRCEIRVRIPSGPQKNLKIKLKNSKLFRNVGYKVSSLKKLHTENYLRIDGSNGRL